MSLLPRPLRGTLSFAHASPKLARLISQRSPGRKPIKIENQPEESGHFQNVGIRPQLVDALKTAFPNVQAPTSVQARLLNAINDRKDVTIKDATGTGK
jgi:superfamily II DNA/RNA helicase